MGLDELEDEVRKGAESESEKMLSDAARSAKAIREEAAARAREMSQAHAARLADERSKIEAREASVKTLELKRMRLAASKSIMETLRPRLLASLRDMPDSENRKCLASLIARAERDLPGGKVSCNARDEGYVRSTSKLAFAGTVPITGGIIATSQDGSVVLDLSFDTLLDDGWGRTLLMFEDLVRLDRGGA